MELTHPHLAPRLKKEYSYNFTTPLGLHAFFYGDLYLYLYLNETAVFDGAENWILRYDFIVQMIKLTFQCLDTQPVCNAVHLTSVSLISP